ncbi:MAG: ribosome biogenesis GTPase Der [Acidimicrobiaceae bacterium]|nr:ribosome biogenesis GTPase Der [Acidimicrobiaceae bacterium]
MSSDPPSGGSAGRVSPVQTPPVRASVPVVAVVGRPNVGKSTLVNRILGRREAIVEQRPGVTRDRKALDAQWQGRRFTLLDTGGWSASGDALDAKVSAQAEQAVSQADAALFVVDAVVGVTADDDQVARVLHGAGLPVLVVANKVDHDGSGALAWELLGLGHGAPHQVSALHGRGTGDLLDELMARLDAAAAAPAVASRDAAGADVAGATAGSDARTGRAGTANTAQNAKPSVAPAAVNMGAGNAPCPSADNAKPFAAPSALPGDIPAGATASSDAQAGQSDPAAAAAAPPALPGGIPAGGQAGPADTASANTADTAAPAEISQNVAADTADIADNADADGIAAVAAEAFSVVLVGRPNAGKSTLFNRLTGEDRAIVHDLPGTTRDSIDTLVETQEGPVRFIDTAGMRRRARIDSSTEYYSLLRALSAVDSADVALLVIDSSVGVTHQDQRLAERVDAAGCPIVVLLNKWDLLDTQDRSTVSGDVADRLGFLGSPPVLRVSALSGKGVARLWPSLNSAVSQYRARIPTKRVNDAVRAAQSTQPAPAGARILYATQVATDPPTFTLFVNRTLPRTYLRYIERILREQFDLGSTALKFRVRRRDG